MRVSISRLSAVVSKPVVSSSTPTPYSWINPAVAGPSTGPLAGRSIAIKDNIAYSHAPTSCSSSILRDFNPPYNATCVSSLLAAGAHINGQTKMDEFGMGSQTTHLPPHYTPVHNPASTTPHEPPRSAGGSSGGSAAAVAEGSCWAALGTDTGGSVRLPASYCGVVGLKPSYGMISRYGVVAYADSLDCVGVLGKNIDVVEEVFDTISHPDSNDMTCVSSKIRSAAKTTLKSHLSQFPNYPSLPLTNLRIGLLSTPDLPIPVPKGLTDHLTSLGATLRTVELPNLSMALPAYYVLASAETASNLGRFGGGWYGSSQERESQTEKDGSNVETGAERRKRIRSEGFGREVKKRILAGTYALTADAFNNSYLKALHLRRLLRQDFAKLFRIPHPLSPASQPTSSKEDGIDILLQPTATRTAPLLDDPKIADPREEYLQDLLTVPASLAGLPALNVPAGKGLDGWPVGVSLVGQWGMEGLVFWAGRGVESWNGGSEV